MTTPARTDEELVAALLKTKGGWATLRRILVHCSRSFKGQRSRREEMRRMVLAAVPR